MIREPVTNSLSLPSPSSQDVNPDGVRVLMVIPGSEQSEFCMPFVRRQFRSLRRRGLNVKPFYLESRTSPVALARALWRFRQAIRAFSPHVIHAQFGTATAFFTAMATARPLVITCRGSDLNPSPSDSWLRNRLGRVMTQLAAWRARRVICVSGSLRDRLWWRRELACVIPNGVDTDAFRLIPREDARRHLGWDLERPIVLFNARNDPQGKRLDLAEAAVDVARQKLSTAHLEILRGNVAPSEMPWYLNAADCLLMTSDYEGSPNIVKEAMACNLPVVSVDVGDTAERLAKVCPSVVVDRDPIQLGHAVLRLLIQRCRSNGREVVLSTLDDNAIAQRIAQIYEEIGLDTNRFGMSTRRKAA